MNLLYGNKMVLLQTVIPLKVSLHKSFLHKRKYSMLQISCLFFDCCHLARTPIRNILFITIAT